MLPFHALLQAATASRKARDFQAAAEGYRRCLEQAPSHQQALRGLADAYRGLGDAAHCLEIWDRYLALNPKDGSVHARVGDACRRCGKQARALAHYQAALRHNAHDRYALMGLGDLHQKGPQPEQALPYWEQLLDLAPDLLAIRTMAGNLCRRKLDFNRAEYHFREALRFDPHNAHAIFGLADALRGLGRFLEAAPFWEEMLARDPRSRQVLCRAGDCFARLGRLEDAEDLFRRALQAGYDRSAVLGLARVHLLRAAPGEAMRCYETILARNPGDFRTSQLFQQAQAAHNAGLAAAERASG